LSQPWITGTRAQGEEVPLIHLCCADAPGPAGGKDPELKGVGPT